MSYQPGSHLIATLKTERTELLHESEAFAALVRNLITKFALQELGAVYHDFTPSGFTAVVCLSESHISIHTWPEYGLVNLDIYLSNFLKVNDGIVTELFLAFQDHFGATVEKELLIKR